MARYHGPNCNCTRCLTEEWVAEVASQMVGEAATAMRDRQKAVREAPLTFDEVRGAMQVMWCGDAACRCLADPVIDTKVEGYWQRRLAEEFDLGSDAGRSDPRDASRGASPAP
jgi:hypothetical protein